MHSQGKVETHCNPMISGSLCSIQVHDVCQAHYCNAEAPLDQNKEGFLCSPLQAVGIYACPAEPPWRPQSQRCSAPQPSVRSAAVRCSAPPGVIMLLAEMTHVWTMGGHVSVGYDTALLALRRYCFKSSSTPEAVPGLLIFCHTIE